MGGNGSTLRVVAVVGVLLGLLIAGAGLIHSVAVTAVAFEERGGYDARLGTLLVVGLAAIGFGALMVLAGVGMWRGWPRAPGTSFLAAAAVALMCLALAPTDGGFWIGVGLYGGYPIFGLILMNSGWPKNRT